MCNFNPSLQNCYRHLKTRKFHFSANIAQLASALQFSFGGKVSILFTTGKHKLNFNLNYEVSVLLVKLLFSLSYHVTIFSTIISCDIRSVT